MLILRPLPALCAGLLIFAANAAAQVLPAHPKKFVPRPITGNQSTPGGGVIVEPPRVAPKRYVTHLVLSDARSWTSSDGKILQGKLIAFEDIVVESPQGAAPPAAPTPPAHPTVVRDGKARLLIAQRASEVALVRLSQPDRDFIERIRAARAKPASAASPEGPNHRP